MILRDLWPGWAWFLTPSGGPYAHPHSLGTLLMETPLLSHPLGAWAAAWFVHIAGLPWGFRCWWISSGICLLWQLFNYERGVYGGAAVREVGWREGLSVVPILPVLWL